MFVWSGHDEARRGEAGPRRGREDSGECMWTVHVHGFVRVDL